MEVWIRRRMIVDTPDTPVAPSRPIRIEPLIKQLSQHDNVLAVKKKLGRKGIFVIITIKIGFCGHFKCQNPNSNRKPLIYNTTTFQLLNKIRGREFLN